MEFWLGVMAGVITGLIVGGIGGWLSHRLALDRSSNEQRIHDQTQRIDSCTDIVAARVAYAAAWHRGPNWHPLRAQRDALEQKHPLDVPAILLEGTSEWDGYVATERRLRNDKETPREERAKQIEAAGAPVLVLLAKKRAAIRA